MNTDHYIHVTRKFTPMESMIRMALKRVNTFLHFVCMLYVPDEGFLSISFNTFSLS